jgi:LuxR family maltose regulon positive regulatory protein
MFTDIAGYTALMQQNEKKAIEARDKHRTIFNSSTEIHKGKILQYYGDGTLSIFNSAIDAVKCGIDMQHGFQEEPSIPVRIGIHIGDIIFSEEEIIGDGVNVASRIESLAVPGSVLISDKVYDEIKNQDSLETAFIKSYKFKNVDKPIEVYAISNEGLIIPKLEDIKGKTDPDDPDDPEKQGKAPQEITKEESPINILSTKLFIPLLRKGIISRSRLTDRIEEGIDGKLTLVSAPAGFGKTTLVSEWIEKSERKIAWVSLDEGDNNPIRFLMYIVSAIQRIEPDMGDRILGLLQSPQSPPIDNILSELLNDISSVITDNFCLVLDDYHIIESKPIDDQLSFLLDHLPPHMHLIITTRQDPDLPLPRMRVRSQLTELRAKDLRFTRKEAVSFLNQVTGLDLSEKDISALEDRTEGWVAGLQLAALSMQGRDDISGFVKSFAGHDRYVVDYLVEEVLQNQTEEVRNFLLQTSILDRLTGPLCDAVTNQKEGKKTLEALERGNLFIIPLDDNRRWYRYHHLFADVLREHLMEEKLDQIPSLHQQASKWFEQNGLLPDAIHHAIKSEDLNHAARLVEMIWPEMDQSFQTGLWLEWFNQLPEEITRDRPVMLVAYCWAVLSDGQLEKGEASLKQAEQSLKSQDVLDKANIDQTKHQLILADIAGARAYIAQSLGDIPGSVNFAKQARDFIPEENFAALAPIDGLLSMAYWANGELVEADKTLVGFILNMQKIGNLSFAISTTFALADIRMTQGNLKGALKVCNDSLQMTIDHGDPPLVGTTDVHLQLSEVYHEMGDFKSSSEHLLKCEKLGEKTALPDWKYRLNLVKAQIFETFGKLDQAHEHIDLAEQAYYRRPIPDFRPFPAFRARLWVREGRHKEAMSWAKGRGLSFRDDPDYLSEYEYITLVRILIGRYKKEEDITLLNEANELLNRLLQCAMEGGRMRVVIEIMILQALVYDAKGDQPSALKSIEPALAIAEPEGFIKAFVNEGATTVELLTQAHKQDIFPQYTTLILTILGNKESNQEGNKPGTTDLINPLSKREMEVLQLISKGFSNQEISERLFLSLSTIKGHNQKIFDKLQVQRRTEAVVRAQELGIL